MNNPGQGLQDSPLVIYGGLVAELNPSDLPEGAAAICCDMDFTVGSVKTRYGVENVYTYANGTDKEVVKCASNLEIGPDETPWADPLNITENTVGTYASVTLGPGGGGGGGGTVGIQNTMVTLTAAQLKGAYATAVELIPATGANLAIVPLSCFMQLNFVTTGYTLDPIGIIGFGTDASDVVNNGYAMNAFGGIMTAGSSQATFFSVTSGGMGFGAFDPATHLVNQPLYWANEVDISGDPGDCTITLNIQWIEVNVTTGQIVNGTGNNVHSSLTNLAAAQINTTDVTTLVPAPGANQTIIPLSAIYYSHYNTTTGGQNLFVGLGTAGIDVQDNAYFYTSPLLNAYAQDVVVVLPCCGQGSSFKDLGGFPNDPSSLINAPLGITCGQPPIYGPPTGGGDETLTLVIVYVVIDVTTGALIPAGSGGGDILGSLTALSAGQIKAANGTPISLVPAPGTNLVNIPISFVATSAFVSTPFSDPGTLEAAHDAHHDTLTGINQTGGAGTNYFIIAGDQTAHYLTATAAILHGNSVGNDGNYTIISSTFTGGNTNVVVSQAIPFAYADSGGIPAPQIFLNQVADAEDNSLEYMLLSDVTTSLFTTMGNQILFGTGQTIQIQGPTNTPDETINAPIVWIDNNDLSMNTGDSTGTAMTQYVSINIVTGEIVSGLNPVSQVLRGQCYGFSVPPGSPASPTFSQANQGNTSASVQTIPFLNPNAEGSGLFAIVRTAAGQPITVSDRNNGLWLSLPVITQDGESANQFFYFTNCKAGPNAVTISCGTSDFQTVVIEEWTSVASLRAYVQGIQTSASPSQAVGNKNDLLIGYTANNTEPGSISGGTNMTQVTPSVPTVVALGGGLAAADSSLLGFTISASIESVIGVAAFVGSSSNILDVVVQINGKQSNLDPGSTVQVTRLDTGEVLQTGQLPITDGTLCFDLGNDFTPAQINSPGFGLGIQAFASGPETTFDVSGMVASVYYTPSAGQFNYVKTFAMTDGEVLTLALDDTGIFWQEGVGNEITTCSGTFGEPMTANVLTPFYTEILPNTFAKSVTYDDREWIALSDLQNGTDMPRQYNGQWVDRVSQVGPGVAPSFSATTTVYDIVSITQPAPVSNLHALLWSVGAGNNHQAGNVITVYYSDTPNPPDPNIYVGGGVVLSGFDTEGGNNPNGSYVVIAVGLTVGGGGSGVWNTFSVQAPTSFLTDNIPPSSASYEASLSTITLTAPAQGVQVGTQILIAGTSVTALDAPWTILTSLNGAQLNITATSLSANVAIYDYTLISGTVPVAGEQVTVTGTTNGDGIFNVVNAVISAASPSNFSLTIMSPDIIAVAEDGAQAIINGTIFQFDPGPTWVGTTPYDPSQPFIFGTSTGGTIVQLGLLGAGIRMGVVMFKTRNGFLTPTSPFATFTTPVGASAINVSNIPLGPPNVIARVIALTGAGGAFYFWIPEPVTVTSSGQQVTYDATIINDNSSTSAIFNITDAVLLAASSIDTQGSNNFAEIELGSCLGFIAYSQRLFAWGEQNKIQNMLNLSFDGGYLLQNPASTPQPAGWTVDPVNGAGGSLEVSPLFGSSYYIQNLTGSTQALYGMIEQDAFEDQEATPIITVETQYGVRVTARSPSGAATGNLVVDLYSPSFNRIYGSFSIPLVSMTGTMQIFTGNLLTNAFTIAVPNDLQYRIYASAIPNGGDVEVDRTEPFDLAEPVLSTQLRGSYFDNFEAFDGVTGNLGVGVENQQSVVGAFELFDNLYVLRTASFAETTDNGITEPDGWTVKEVSNKIGTASIYSYDVGEGWALTAGQPGLYLFEGGKPQKISPEIDPLWQAINWKYGYTMWLRNDTNNRRILIGVPLATPNQWMPNFPVNANPTQPNIVLTCTYKELMTASALAGEGSIRQGFTGQLRTFQLGRRWSVWSIQAAYADFIQREDTTTPIFFCSDTSPKIYQQITGNYLDDGHGILDEYVTYPFLQSQEAQQIHAGLHELLATYASALLVGEGNVNITILPDTLGTPYGDALEPLELGNPPAWGDTEFPLNDVGSRFFVGFETLEPGDWFELSRLVLTVTQNPWAPVRGSN